MPVCKVCSWDWAWDPDHTWTSLGIGPGDEEIFLCELCKKQDAKPYNLKHLLWEMADEGCCMHIVVSDQNLSDEDVHWCIAWAKNKGHTFCEAVGNYLLTLPEQDRTF